MSERVSLLGRTVALRAALAAAVLSLLGSIALAKLFTAEHASSIGHQDAAPAGLSSLPLAAEGPVSSALGGDSRSYQLSPAPGGGYEGLSAAQRLRSRFSPAGAELSDGKGRLGLRLEKIGYGASLSTVEPVTPTADANRVTYSHPHAQEWYANGPGGIEQGFALPRAPGADHSGRLTLSIAVSGDLAPALARGGRAVTFSGPGAVLHYRALVATDSRGRTLPSSMSVEAGHLLLRVDDSGARFPLRVDPLVQSGEALTVEESAGAVGDGQLGFSVALSADGNTALVGAPADNGNAGAVWMFVRSGGEWTQQGAKLTGGEPGAGGGGGCGAEEGEECSFGRSLALSADGRTAIVGGPREPGPCPTGECRNQGAAWVFTREGSAWTPQATLSGGEEESIEGRFGRSVALSGDGHTAVVGAPANAGGGAAWVFTWSGSSWQRHPKLGAGPEERGLGFFGRSVAISGDGSTAVVGAPGDDGFTGAAWAFAREGAGEVWRQVGGKLLGADEAGPEGRFGFSLALSNNGATALVGGRGDGQGAGAAWVFTREAEEWRQQGAKLTGGTEEEGEAEFGYSVSLSADGSRALVGAPRESEGTGAAWLFARSPEGWSKDGPKLAGVSKGWFGSSVSLGADGRDAMIGAPAYGGKAGAVWQFSDPATIPFIAEISPSIGPAAGGTTVTITGSRLGQATKVQFGASEATFTVNSESSITAISPAHAAGRVPVIVTTPEGKSQGLLSAPEFTYVLAPGIHEVVPPEGLTTGRTVVRILGSHLGETTAVTFGSVPAASFNVVSQNEITAVSPGEPAGRVILTVSTVGGAARSHFTFVAPPPSAGSDPQSQTGSPAPVAAGSGAVLGFGPLCNASLLSRNIAVLSRSRAAVKLIWRGGKTCSGRFTLSVRVKAGKRTKTKTIASGRFSLAPGRARTVTVTLNRLGRGLLGAAHGRLRASLVIINVTGSSTSAHTASVRLVVQKPKAKAHKK